MTGNKAIEIRIDVTCFECQMEMKLTTDVERDMGEYRCAKCNRTVWVEINVGN